RAQLQITLEPRRRVLRPLPFVTVRKQADEARHAQPLALAGGDELIEYHLRAIGEVAELCFPQRQRLGLGQRIAVLEAEHCLLREHRVDDLEAGLRLAVRPVAQVIERGVAILVLLIDQHRVALREGAALAVLAGEPNGVALFQERAERQRLGAGPVEALASIGRPLATLTEALDAAADVNDL